MLNKFLYLLAGAGGFIGSIMRFAINGLVQKFLPASMHISGTLAINVIGSFAIGIILGMADKGKGISPEWRVFLATGICGGFTTFSAFSYENVFLLKNGQAGLAMLYISLSLILGLGATWVGLWASGK